jgi:hypothetical protein
LFNNRRSFAGKKLIKQMKNGNLKLFKFRQERKLVMETFRKILNGTFIFVVIVVFLAAVILFSFGAFPVNINPGGQRAKFDIAYFGWQPRVEGLGELEITFKEKERKVGIGALKYSYNTNQKDAPGFLSEAYPIEGLTRLEFYMKSEKPSVWQVRIKRKSTGKYFHKTFKVDKEWKHYGFLYHDLNKETDPEKKLGRVESTDFLGYIEFLDVSHKKYPNNTIWFDDLTILR